LGSGILKILSPPQLLHDKVFHLVGFFHNSFKPGLSFLLWSASFDDTAIVDDAASGIETIFARIGLSSVCRALILPIIRIRLQWLSAISFKVTWFVTVKTFEDFPLPYWCTHSSSYSFWGLVTISSLLIIFCLR
jgi:hypothetical protein